MPLNLQPTLANEHVKLIPLQEADFEALYAVACDPLIWEQHPNRDRWKRDVFANFFDGAMKSGGAFKVVEVATSEVMGCTRIYDYDEAANSILIGYTFFGRKWWGKGINRAVKSLMLDYLFAYVEEVGFHIGAVNVRSQISIERMGARKVDELEVAYYGEAPKLNFVYSISKGDWTG